LAEDRFEELLGPYLLGELTVEEERELEAHLEEDCPRCRGELARLRRTHALIQATADVTPPPELKDQVLAQVRGDIPTRSGGGRWFWASVAAALLVVAVLGVGLLRVIAGEPSSGVPLTATDLAPEAGGEVRMQEAGENIRVELEVWGMPKLEEDEYYEMWYYAEDGDRISCGTFRTGAEGRTIVNLTAPASSRDYPEIEITREPDDGDPGSSGEEILEGKLRST
jgi:anti-sigma-K factor RskA